MSRKIYVVGGVNSYANWMEGEIVDTMEEADLVVFTGGEDVSPEFYKEPKHPYTRNNKNRDSKELNEFIQAMNLDKHIIGICRGSQLSCVLSGGKLVQHQDNPTWLHPIKVYGQDGELNISSTHHQAMYPYNLPKNEYKILGWTEGMLKSHQNGRMEEMLQDGQVEVEICYFPKTRALGIQGHPEMMMRQNEHPETIAYLRGLLDAHMNGTL